jgi:hypothetical protein
MDLWRAQVRPHPYPLDLYHIAREFGRQLDDASCALAAVRHGLLLGGLTVPEGTLGAIFGRTYPDGVPGKTLLLRLRDLGLDPVYLKKPSGQQTHRFLEELGHEMQGGAFVLVCIYGGNHWITLGRYQGGRIRAVDSHLDKSPGNWDLGIYNLTPEAFDYWDWENCVQLIRPGIWQKNYEEWLPGRDRLLRLAGPSAPMERRLQDAAQVYLNDDRYSYERLELFLSDKSRMVVVEDPGSLDISVNTPTAIEPEGQVVVVRRLARSEPGRPGPPELICRLSRLYAWQLR